MANTLMFEVGVKEAGNQLTNLETRLKNLVNTYGSLKIKVEVDKLEAFVSALKSIGDGKQLEPLLRRIDALQSSLTKINGSMGNIDLSSLEKQLKSIEETRQRIKTMTDDLVAKGVSGLNIKNATATDRMVLDNQIKALEKNFGMTVESANAYIQKSKQAGNASNELNGKIDQLAQSISNLSTKTFSVNMGSEFKTWAEQVQGLTTQVKELIEQLMKLHQVQGQGQNSSMAQGNLFDPQKFNTLQKAIDKIISEINRLQQAFTHLGENSSLSNLTTYINGLAVTLSTLSNAIKLQPLDEQTKRLIEENELLRKKLVEVGEAARYINVRNGEKTQDKAAEIQKIAGAQQNVNSETEKGSKAVSDLAIKYETLIARIENWQATLSKLLTGGESKYFGGQLTDAISAYEKALRSAELGSVFDESGEHLKTLKAVLTQLGVEFANVNKEAAAFNREQEKAAKGAWKNHLKSNEESARVQAAEYKAMQKNARDARVEAEKMLAAREKMLRSQSESLSKIMSGGKEKLDTYQYEQVREALRAIRNELREIETAKQRGGLSTGALLSLGGGTNDYAAIINAYKQFISGKHEAAAATSQLTAEEQKFAQAINHSTQEMRGQSQVLSDLKMMAMQYLSVWGAQSLVHNIIETGGLLEQQRLSIGAILQNAGQATELFGQIKQLALKSPFGVVQLDKMSKQLTAYGFEYKELYEWTKRLADISAATGTSVDRLALALGHVRAEGALSGYTLRQFAMGNVPLLRMLAENLNITTKQVREKVRKKDISYEDVMNVLQQLTDKGGMFYEAQETMSQALNAKYKNLRDAFDIMYNEIAESSVGDALKEIAVILTAGAKQWGRYAKDIMGVVAVLGVAKTAMWAYNSATAAGANSAMVSIARAAKQEQANLRLAASYRTLTATEQQDLITRNALVRSWYNMVAPMKMVTTRQLAIALSTKKLSQEELYRAVALRQLSKAKAEQVILDSKLSDAMKGQMLLGLQNIKVFSKWRVALIGFGNALKGVFTIAKSFAPLLIIGAVVDLFSRVSEMKDKANEAASDLAQKATSDIKVLKETFKELMDDGFIEKTTNTYKYINGKRVGSVDIEFNEDKLRSEDLTDEIENLKKKLQDLSPMYEGDLVDIDKMEDQVEQFKRIVKKLESIRHANNVTEAMANVITDADVDVAGKHWWTRMFGDTYSEDVKDYEDRLASVSKDVNEINEETIDNIDRELGGRLTQLQKKYALDSKNNSLTMVFEDWAKKGVPNNISRQGLADQYFGSITETAFSRSLRNQYKQMESDTKEMAEKMSSIIVNQFKDDPDGAIYAITNYMKKLMSIAGVTDPRVIEMATQMMLDEMRNYLPKNMQDSVINEMQRRILKQQFTQMLGSSVTESTSTEEAEKIYQKAAAETKKWGEQMGYDLKKIGMDNADAYRDAFKAQLNRVMLKTDWQKRASKVFVHNVSIKNNFDKSLDEFAQAVQKDLKDKQNYLDRNKAHLKMTLNIDTAVMMNADKLKALMDKLAQQGQAMAAGGDWEGAKALYSKIDKEIRPFYDALMAVNEDKEWLKKEGYPETDPTKGKKGSGSQEDKDAKELRERMRILKEAADAYKYWKNAVGEGGAEEHVNKEFGDVLSKLGYSFRDVKQFRKVIMDEVKKYEDIYNKSGKKRPQLLEAIKEGYKTDAGLERNQFEEESKDFASRAKIEIDSLTRAWEMFNSVREATGNIELAIELSGAEYEGGKTRNMADALREKIQKDFDAAGGGIAFDINLSDEDIEDKIKAAVPAASEKQIAALVEKYKKWRDLQRDVLKSDIGIFTKLVGGAKDYDSQLRLITDELNKQIEANNELVKNGVISQESADKANERATFEARDKAWKASVTYSQLMNNSLALTREEIDYGINIALDMLNQKMQQGLITAQEYADEMAKIRNIQSEWNKNATLGGNSRFWAGATGGIQGVRTYNKENINKIDAEIATIKQRAANGQSYDGQRLFKLKEQRDKGTKYNNYLDSLEGVFDKFEALSKALDPVVDLFDKLGMGTTAKVIGAGQSALSSAKSMGESAESLIAGAGPYGAALGAGLSIASSIISMHDDALQKQIDALKRNNAALEANTEVIKAMRERTLGYDTGELRKQFSSMYNNTRKTFVGWFGSLSYNDPALQAMQEFYKTNSNGNGYSQELANLKKERENYLEMYNAEQDKKDSSEDALLEYKQKIAELDEQIMFFVEDLANELWSIDVKGWADQIGDALWTAFENGEDAMEAFHNTAKSIVSDVSKRMMTIGYIEPMLKGLESDLFGSWDANSQRYVGGALKYDKNGNINMAGSEQDVLEVLGKWLGGGRLQGMVDGAEQFYEWVKQITGIDLSSDDSKTSSKVIQGGFTENETGLLLSYTNAMRADLSINREMIAQYFPMYYQVMTSNNSSLKNIENHTAAIMRSNDAIKQDVTDIYSLFRGLKNNVWKIPMA